MSLAVDEFVDLHSLLAFNEHFHGTVRQFQELQDMRHDADLVDIFRCRIVMLRIHLRRQKQFLLGISDDLQCLDGLRPTYEQRNDHAREDDDVSKRQDRVRFFFARHGCSCRTNKIIAAPPSYPTPAPQQKCVLIAKLSSCGDLVGSQVTENTKEFIRIVPMRASNFDGNRERTRRIFRSAAPLEFRTSIADSSTGCAKLRASKR